MAKKKKAKAKKKMIEVLFINNAGAGFADPVECEDGITAGEFFAEMMPEDASPTGHLITVNALPAAEDQLLENEDTVTITPTNVKGSSR